jgi:hypothetical protein
MLSISKRNAKMSYPRYKNNPFIDDMVIPIGKQSIRVSRLGSQGDVLVNQSTGEVSGTHVSTYRKVDSEQFVKLFTANIAMTFDLTSAGIKTFNVLMWSVQRYAISKDQVDLDQIALNDFLESQGAATSKSLKLSMPTFKRGLNELEKANILAKTSRMGRYFFNPNFVFNGDRIAFTTVIERTDGDSHLQQNLLPE